MSLDETRPQWHEVAYRWLSAPLLITVVGAGLINFVIPEITRKSENHQRALDVKTGLVGDMSEAVARALTASRLVATDVVRDGTTAHFNRGLQAWKEQQAKLGTELEAYFPGTGVGSEWKQYGQIVTDVYFLSGSGLEDRPRRVKRLLGALGTRGWCSAIPDSDWAAVKSENEPAPRTPGFHQSYVRLNSCVLTRSDDLVQQVLRRTPSGF
jgi:hypothetical protein